MRGRSLGSPLYNSGAPSLSPYSNEAAPGRERARPRAIRGGGRPSAGVAVSLHEALWRARGEKVIRGSGRRILASLSALESPSSVAARWRGIQRLVFQGVGLATNCCHFDAYSGQSPSMTSLPVTDGARACRNERKFDLRGGSMAVSPRVYREDYRRTPGLALGKNT